MKRLYSLDALRGVAALSVVLWHWQHFYAMTGVWQAGWRREAQPLYFLLKPFYLEGWAAVDVFFALSGFVFFWLYAAAIAEGKVLAGDFALKRFSRLYPLHLLTLAVVAALQYVFRGTTGNDFIFSAADPVRFVAQLFVTQQWLPPTIDQTFNGPAWTVSIEAGLYVIFFALCRHRLSGPRLAMAFVAAGATLMWWNEFIARGLMGFFVGGASYYAVERWRRRADAGRIAKRLMLAAAALWGLAILEIVYAPLNGAILSILTAVWPQVIGPYLESAPQIYLICYVVTVVPVTLMALALREIVADHAPGRICRGLSRLGDISFSTYMLHFPLQIAFALTALAMGWNTTFFEHPATLAAFYAALIGLGLLSWRHFECPAQRVIRTLRSPQAS